MYKAARGEISGRFFYVEKQEEAKKVPQMDIKCVNYGKLLKQLEGLNKDASKAIQKTVNDAKTRGPAQVTKAVTSVYGIATSDVTAAGKAAKGGAKTVGSIRISGQDVDVVHLTYSGRVLTPQHFKMKPTKRPVTGKKYTVTAEVFKGKRKALGSQVFLGSNGKSDIPFVREGSKRLPIKALRTVSIPQMIENEEVAAKIKENIDELLVKRLQHYTEQLGK